MSAVQPASTLRHGVGARPWSRDLSAASTTGDVTKAPNFAETQSRRDPQNTADPAPVLQNVVALRQSTVVTLQALNLLETLARKAASGDKNAVETLSALIPIATLFQPAATQVSMPEVTPKPVFTPDLQALTSTAAPTPATKPEPEPKKLSTATEKIVKFGDSLDKGLKPLTLLVGTFAAATTIARNFGS
jgi:hypothetical protein